mmetsp:Transcript_23603/g.58320  ORF Transcript_23603/g.58320 Transcript_23603/m.58320 type:complete len:227 (-) Transcript_23603:470-1150(-)
MAEGPYKTLERRMGQLQKAAHVFGGNVEILSGVNKSLVGFHSVFSDFIVGIQTAAARLEVVPSASPYAPETSSSSAARESAHVGTGTASAPPAESQVHSVPEPRAAKKAKGSAKKRKAVVEKKEPELTGPAKVQAELKAMIPPKFHTEGHLKQIYQVLKAACKDQDGASVPKLTCDTGLGRVQLEEYLAVLVRCNQLLKMRVKGLKFVGNTGNLLETSEGAEPVQD